MRQAVVASERPQGEVAAVAESMAEGHGPAVPVAAQAELLGTLVVGEQEQLGQGVAPEAEGQVTSPRNDPSPCRRSSECWPGVTACVAVLSPPLLSRRANTENTE